MSESKKKPCRNCGRKMTIPADGLCGACYNSVRLIKKDSPEYTAALAAVKERVNDPNFRPGGYRLHHKRSVKKDIPTKKPDGYDGESATPTHKLVPHAQQLPVADKKVYFEANVAAIPFQSSGATDHPMFDGLDAAIDKLRAERDFCMAKAEKITRAIEILQS